MTIDEVVTLVETDLDILDPDTTRAAQITHLVNAAKAYCERQGVTFDEDLSIEQADVLRLYAAYLFRKRDSMEGMGPMLRKSLNNLIFAQKCAEVEGTDET